MRWFFIGLLVSLTSFFRGAVSNADDYSYGPYREGRMEPQISGWPLTKDERDYVLKSEHERRPGRESNKHLPSLWPIIPSAGHWGGTSWLDTHAKLVDYVQSNSGRVDVLLVGDSITQQWGSPLDSGSLNAPWKKEFSGLKTLNIGIGGDKTQNVLWRLEHGGVDGLEPRVIVLMVGNNNMFFTPETSTNAAAQGIATCARTLRRKFLESQIIVIKILPAHEPGNRFYEDIRKTNAELDLLQLDEDPKVRVLDLWSDFTDAEGTLKKELFTSDAIHLSLEGYRIYAERLRPTVELAIRESE